MCCLRPFALAEPAAWATAWAYSARDRFFLIGLEIALITGSEGAAEPHSHCVSVLCQ